MEQRLIDANVLAKRMQYLIGMRVYDAFDCLNEIDAAPTIDAVPVVRCKDCKWSGSNRVGNLCNCAINMHLVKLNDYCSQGKRRADNG